MKQINSQPSQDESKQNEAHSKKGMNTASAGQ